MNYFNQKLKPTMDWIITDNDEFIRNVSKDIDIENLSEEEIFKIQQMTRFIDVCYMQEENNYQIEAGIGISAIQVGLAKKIGYLHFDDEYLNQEIKILFANPIILEKSNDMSYLEHGEGCLSVPNKRDGIVPRNYWIKVKYYDLIKQKYVEETYYDFLAIVFQHEIDHMAGKLYYDHINVFYPHKTNPEWKLIK